MDSNAWKRYLLVAFVALISIGGVAFGFYLLLNVFSTLFDQAIGVFFLVLLTINAVFNLAGGYYFLYSFGVYKPAIVPLKRFPTVGVVVPFRNEKPGVVQRTLEPLLKLDYPRENYSVYAIDNSTCLNILGWRSSQHHRKNFNRFERRFWHPCRSKGNISHGSPKRYRQFGWRLLVYALT